MPTLEELEALATKARPINEDDWGTERQVEAENEFFDVCRKLDPATFDTDGGSDFAEFCLKATTGEMLDEAMKLVRRHFDTAATPGLR